MSERAELVKKYERSQTFKKQMEKSEANYQILNQRSLYSGLSISECNFIQKYQGKNRMEADIYFIDGGQQYAKARNIEKLTLALITKIPKPSNKYILVYLNDPDYSSSFSDFKTVLEIMPIQYFVNLVKILLVKPTLLERAGRYFVFGLVPKFINSQIENIDDIQQLSERLVMDNKELMKYMPQYWQEHSPTPRHNTNVHTQVVQSNNIGHKPVQKVEVHKYEINQYDKSQNGLPELFQLLVYYFQEHPEGLLLQGIFRKSANIEEQTEAMEQMSKKHYRCLDQIHNPHIIANLIKKFLGGLKTPIIPFDMFMEIMDYPSLNTELLAKKMKELSQINLTKLLTLMFLLQFLMSSVIINAHKNKMTADNIAICFAPCIMWAKERSIKDIAYATKSVQVMSIMIKNFEEVFGNRKNQEKLYRESYLQHKSRSLEAVMLFSDQNEVKHCSKIEEGTDQEDQSGIKLLPNDTQDKKSISKIEQQSPQVQPVKQNRKRGIFTSKLKLQNSSANKSALHQKQPEAKDPNHQQ